jgi:hypothetical protein
VNRHRVLSALTAACVASAIALVGVSVATPSAEQSKSTKTFKFVFKFSDAHVRLDLGSGALTTGDTDTYTGPVLNEAGTSRVGFAQGHCVITLPNRPLAQCTVSYFFDHGQIATQGPNYYNRPFNHAITGGTGVFREAKGEMRAAPLPGEAGWNITLKVIR